MKKYILLDHATGEFDVFSFKDGLEKRCEEILQSKNDLEDYDFVVAKSLDINITQVVRDKVTMSEQKKQTLRVPLIRVEGELESPDTN